MNIKFTDATDIPSSAALQIYRFIQFECEHLIPNDTYILHISAKFENEDFFVPTRITCGGFITNRFFSPATMSGFFSRIMSNTLFNNCNHIIIFQQI